MKGKSIAALAAVAALGLTGCSGAATGTEFQAIRYSGGALDIEKFKECHPQSVREYGSWGDNVYYYPANQRTFAFTDDPNAKPETGPIAVTTKDSQQVTVRGFITFQLTQDCKLLQQFHERIGKRYDAHFEEAGGDQDEGWSRFLADYFTVPVNTIMDAAGLESTWRELYTNKERQAAFETSVKNRLAAEIGIQAGDGVIEVLNISIQRPEPDRALIDALAKVEQARADGAAKVERVNAEKAVATAEKQLQEERAAAMRECRRVLSEAGCITLKLAENDKIQFWPVPNGGNLNVTPK